MKHLQLQFYSAENQTYIVFTGLLKMSSKTDQLEILIEPTVNAFGCQLWGIQLLTHDGHNVLRIYIDKTSGVCLEDCEKVSRQVSAVLDVEDPVSGQYSLEVSSPGLDRPLFTFQHYAKNIGEKINIQLHIAFEGQKKFCGVISRADSEKQEIGVVCDEHEFLFPFETIKKANIVPCF